MSYTILKINNLVFNFVSIKKWERLPIMYFGSCGCHKKWCSGWILLQRKKALWTKLLIPDHVFQKLFLDILLNFHWIELKMSQGNQKFTTEALAQCNPMSWPQCPWDLIQGSQKVVASKPDISEKILTLPSPPGYISLLQLLSMPQCQWSTVWCQLQCSVKVPDDFFFVPPSFGVNFLTVAI